MAYAAVCCLELTIERLLNSSRISIVQWSQELLQHLYDEILSLKEALEEFDRKRSTINMKMVKTLEAGIIDVLYQFEDVIDPHLSDQFHPLSEEEESTDHPPSVLYSVDIQEVKQDIDSFIETVNKMKRTYIHELLKPSPDEEDEDDCVVSSRIDFGENESNIVGLSDLFTRIKDRLNSSRSERMIVSLRGMAGIGKTTLAKKLFQYPFTVKRKLLFVTIGPKYQLADILLDILTQLNADTDEIMLTKREKLLVELKRMVFKSLKSLRYLIVLDDVWDKELCIELVKFFREDNNGSRVLLTTRLYQVGSGGSPSNTFRMPFLDKKESWDLLRRKVFGEQESLSYEFAKAGKKIAENCEGLPLTIVTVADILSKSSKTAEYWNVVADDKQHSVYKDAYEQMSKVLYPSYNYLEQHLKACFLYFGAFPQNDRVYANQLINLWSAEGFLNSKPVHYLDSAMNFVNVAYNYLDGFFSRNVIMFDKETCRYYLHSSFWYLCNKEAAKNKLFYALNCHANASLEEGNIKCQRRLCIRNNVLLAIEDVQNSIASALTARSLLCTGDFHKYPVPLCLEQLMLLRVLDAHSVRLYEFPMEVVKLVQLRYLALVYNGDLPSSISKLLNLQHLIVKRHQMIISYDGNLSHLPIEIWNMKELKSLKTRGRDLPHPSNCEGSLLPNLLTLTGVGPQSCTKYVLEKIPYLKELLIKIDLPPDAAEQLSCFDHISHLHQLEELECQVVNPILKTEVVTPLAPPFSDLPSSLTTIILSGLGYQWEEMSKISLLPNLKRLTLQCYAFRGPKWEVHDKEFQKLVFLEIGDTDLEQCTIGNYSCLPAIRVLRIVHCYKLKEIPMTFGTSLRIIEVVDCNPMAIKCANKLKQYRNEQYGDENSLFVHVHSSWDDGNIQS